MAFEPSSVSTYDPALVRAWALEHHLAPVELARWLALGAAGAAALLDFARELGLRTGQTALAIEMLEEIALREGLEVPAILERAELRAIVRGPGSRPQRASAFIERLHELRYPRLAAARAELKRALADLRLPAGLAVVLPKDLSSDEVVIRLTAHSAAELEVLLAALNDRAPGLKALIGTVAGEDDKRGA